MFLLAKLGRAYFSQALRKEPIILFASYPVGFPMLKKLHSTYQSISVVTNYSDPKKIKQNHVQAYCKSNNIPLYTPVKKQQSKQERIKQWQQFIEVIKNTNIKFRIGVLCSYGYLIPENVIKLFQKGMILAHPSLIPKYRGGSPIFHAIANGQKQSGASFMQISPNKFDHGNLLHQIKKPIGEKDSYEKIQKQLSQLMADNILHVIDNIDSLRPGKNQQDLDVSGIPPHQLEAKIYKQKRLNVTMTAQQVYNWSRALIVPRVLFNEKEIIVFFDKIFKQDEKGQYTPGQIILIGKQVYMKCSDKLIKLSGWKQLDKKQLAMHTFVNRFINKEKYNNQIFFK